MSDEKKKRGPRRTLQQQLEDKRDALRSRVAELRYAERELAKIEKALEAFVEPAVDGWVSQESDGGG